MLKITFLKWDDSLIWFVFSNYLRIVTIKIDNEVTNHRQLDYRHLHSIGIYKLSTLKAALVFEKMPNQVIKAVSKLTGIPVKFIPKKVILQAVVS